MPTLTPEQKTEIMSGDDRLLHRRYDLLQEANMEKRRRKFGNQPNPVGEIPVSEAAITRLRTEAPPALTQQELESRSVGVAKVLALLASKGIK